MNEVNKSTMANAEFDQIITKRQISKLDQLFASVFGDSKEVVAVLRLSGVIGKVSTMQSGLTLESLNELIEKTFKIKKLKALCLIINSPGGSPVQSELIAKRIRDLAKENKIKVYSFIEDMAASGGYWLACSGDQIYALPSSVIGSIGVVSSGFGFHEAINKLGIERRVYTEGKNKAVLDPFKPINKDDLKIIKDLQKQVYEHFVEYVKNRRAGKLTQQDEILFNGEFWAGQTALDYGLIDGIGDMYSVIKEKFGDNIKFQYLCAKQPWLKKKLGMRSKILIEDLVNTVIDTIENKIITDKFNMK
ncbi:S49 family peptidase [Rickettsia prowazekii]|nr:S49 family peptidase [Rickettsia prowazekii]EOB09764.1 protease SOHB [Rickettsia prowazekii str. GvF12]ADE29924.1 Signal peptide peptidase SppA, 36K type [Rickettsia prowazekii str. Rp22]AFE49211.1 protease SohB [Rickettsia prowazekii str. Chernikova]AFE50057.1 protease SohB [Rickettsia prowazekii str. Katsinyian]AFE50902.1 protease SohB [Rickettsia prowazekii str. BuV67-CWPP]